MRPGTGRRHAWHIWRVTAPARLDGGLRNGLTHVTWPSCVTATLASRPQGPRPSARVTRRIGDTRVALTR